MKTINYRVTLDMFDTIAQATIKAKKGDSACQIHITLTKNGKLYKINEGCHATFNAKKADGNFVYDNCTIEGDTIVYDFASSIGENGICQISACEGNVECEVTLFNDKNEQLTSPRFTLVIDGTVYNGEEIISTPESNVLKELIIEANETVSEIETKLANGEFKGEKGEKGDPGEIANIDQTYSPTSENAQSGIAVEQINPHIKYIESTEDNMVELYGLDEGIYVLNGVFLLHTNNVMKINFYNYLVSVKRNTAKTYWYGMWVIPNGNRYAQLKIASDGTYSTQYTYFDYLSDWRKITELTLAEDSVVSITADSEGKSFSLKGFRIHMNIPATANGVTPWLHCNYTNNSNAFAFCQANAVPADKIGLIYFFAELKGVWLGETATHATVDGNPNTLTGRYGFIDGVRRESITNIGSKTITKIQLNGGYSGVLPSGTKIEIWGLG